mmetsp:Transcript_1238/g.1453  ORF Transcript_1238/g.1453 Transcript_1238/m.1453 type:complete len:507 (-) Transcript_1238:202-1722(-)
MSITSDELNFLVYRYLQESGFVHSSFVFAYESLIGRSNIATADIPPGTLIHFLQKGLQYVEIEKQLEEDASKKENDESDSPGKDKKAVSLLTAVAQSGLTPSKRDRGTQEAEAGTEKSMKMLKAENDSSKTVLANGEATVGYPVKKFKRSDVIYLKGHDTQEVYSCSWHPKLNLLATSAADSTVRIWTIPRGPCDATSEKMACSKAIVLKHESSKKQNRDVTVVAWNCLGTLLASGSGDGYVRVWSNSGELKLTLVEHKATIFSLKWNKKGNYLLTASVDQLAIVWDVESGAAKQKFDHHKGGVLDIDWRDDNSFVSCGADNAIHYCAVGQDKPLRSFYGHKDDVNAILWSPNGELFASCSDDRTVKIWNPDNGECIKTLTEHTREVYTLKWSPESPMILATGSFDSTVKIWDVGGTPSETSSFECLHTMKGHDNYIYDVAFSPNGKYLVSGSTDKSVNVWNARTGKLLQSYSTVGTSSEGTIYRVAWNHTGDKIAACACVFDFTE